MTLKATSTGSKSAARCRSGARSFFASTRRVPLRERELPWGAPHRAPEISTKMGRYCHWPWQQVLETLAAAPDAGWNARSAPLDPTVDCRVYRGI